MIATWKRQGWPGEPDVLHRKLLKIEELGELFGEAWAASSEGPLIRWPANWGSWSYAAHRETIRRHRIAVGETDQVSEWYRRLAAGGAAGT